MTRLDEIRARLEVFEAARSRVDANAWDVQALTASGKAPVTPATEAGQNHLFRLGALLHPHVTEELTRAVVSDILAIEQQAVTAAIESGRVVDPSSYVLAGHKCRPVAVMPMKEGRDWCLGQLTEPLADWPLETHCLHITTPLKSVVLGIMRADTDLLAVLCRIVSGYIPTERWMDGLERSMRAQAALRLEGVAVDRDAARALNDEAG